MLRPKTRLIMFGVVAGDRRVRIGFSTEKEFGHVVLAYVTKDDGVTCDVVPKSGKGKLTFPADKAVRLDMAITANSRVTLRYNDIVVADAKVSSFHARIDRTSEGFVLVDLKSRNGCWVNGKRAENTLLATGDEIRVGAARVIYKVDYTSSV